MSSPERACWNQWAGAFASLSPDLRRAKVPRVLL